MLDQTPASPNSVKFGSLKRLNILEQDVAGIKTDIHYIRTELVSLSKSIGDISSSNKTNWGTLAAWATVIIAIMLYHNQLTFKPLESFIASQQSFNAKLTEDFQNHLREKAHPQSQIVVDNLSERQAEDRKQFQGLVKDYDGRFTSLIYNAEQERIRGLKELEIKLEKVSKDLDDKLQIEMRLMQEAINHKIDSIRELVNRLEKHVEKNETRVYGSITNGPRTIQ